MYLRFFYFGQRDFGGLLGIDTSEENFKTGVMSLDLPTFSRYLRVLQAEGQTHLTLSKSSLQVLRNLVSKAGSLSAHSSSANSTSAPYRATALIRSSLDSSARSEGEKGVDRSVSTPVSPVLPSAPAIFKETSVTPSVDLKGLDLESGSRVEQLERLRMRASQCQQCAHLAASRRSVVFGGGNPEASLLFVGEAPGPEEDESGEVFVGAAGQLLTKMIEAMGLKREEIYIANVLKCRPDMPEGAIGNRKPTVAEMGSCLPFLEAQIKIVQPKIIVALGATAMEGLLHEKTPMGKLRGNWLSFQGIPLIPTYHPTYLLRNQSVSEKRKVWEDLLKVMEALTLPISEKQRGYFLSKN